MRVRALAIAFALSFVVLPRPAAAFDNPLALDTNYVETENLKLIWFEPLGYLAPHVTRTFTNSLAWQRRMFGWTPSEPTIVLLKDLSDFGYASAAAAPRGRLLFDVAPVSREFETFPASERFYQLMNHELVHIAQGDVANDADRFWRRAFLGKVFPLADHPETLLYSYLTIPRFTAPRWYVEGSAVFMETWMGGGLGRAQGGFDEMVFRAMVRDSATFFDPLGLESRGVRTGFQVIVNAYLYGTRFMTWLAYAYGPEQVVAWLRRDDGSARYFADNFRVVFGRELDDAWQEWIAFEHDFQRKNLAEVRKFPITPHRQLSARVLGSVSRTYYDEATGTLYGAFRYPGVVEHIGAVSAKDGSERRLADIKKAMLYKVASVAYDASTGTVFFTNDNFGLRDLMAVDVNTGATRMLLQDARVGDITVNPVDHVIWGVEHSNGIAHLVRIPPPYNDWYRVFSFNYEYVPTDLDISPDGKLLSASISEPNADQYLRVFPLDKVAAGDLTPLSEFKFGQSVPESFVFSKDGRYLYGSSYYTGVSNIFRYEVTTGAVETVSNAESGYFRPMPLADGRLVVLNYTAEGFVPVVIDPVPLTDVSAITFLGTLVAQKYPVLASWQVPPPSTVDYEKLVVRQGEYRPLRQLGVENGFPVLQGYKDAIGVGYQAYFSDPLNIFNVSAMVAGTPRHGYTQDEQAHAEIVANYLGLHGSVSWNKSDFYDLFGPTKRSRKGLAVTAGYNHLILFDEPRHFEGKVDVKYYDKIDTLPGNQNVQTNFTRLLTGEAGLYYTDARRSLGAVDDEKGLAWSALGIVNRVNGETIWQLRGNFDYGWDLPLANSSIWLRTAAGLATNKRDNSVANFYFGGFGNNYVDRGSIKRYREYGSMPGFEIDEISGLSFVRPMLEWNLPPVVFERVGMPAFHLTWLRSSLFATGLWTDPERSQYRKDYANLGAQFDLRFSVLHWYEMTLSAGYAFGFREGRRAGEEFMISLKIM
ncbi:MAG TPA: hypothetical protein VFQ55_14760 [Casimicrobiaceae bacterium]|nr:hypothetical protein [Casimicrobiaceae bacterium]